MASSTAPPNANGPPPNPSGASKPGGLLFDGDKQPTRLLNAVLRAMGQYIIDSIGDKSIDLITAKKLAEVFKRFPSDMDSFLTDTPPRDLSNIWSVMGFEHYLIQPENNRYAKPSLPALTLTGFVRWMAVQLLVDPGENVPVVKFAISHWKLKNPDTGAAFPDLPAAAFPSEPDRKTEEWEEQCGKKLLEQAKEPRRPSGSTQPETFARQQATRSPPRYTTESRRGPPEFVRVPTSSSTPRGRSGTDPETIYATRVPYTHVPNSARYRRSPERGFDQDWERERDRAREKERAFAERVSPRHPGVHIRYASPEGSRRRSFTEYTSGERPQPKDYGPHSQSDPHLKSSQNATSIPPTHPPHPASTAAQTSVPPPTSSAPRSGPRVVRTTRREGRVSESDTTGSDTDSETSGSSDDESPGGTRPPRRRVPRPSSRQTHGDATIPESVDRVFRDRATNGDIVPPMASGGNVPPPAGTGIPPHPSPRLRPSPGHGHIPSSDPRRRSQGGLPNLVGQIPIIGPVLKDLSGAAHRRPHSHDSRFQPARASRRYSDEEYPSSNDEYDPRRRPVRNPHLDAKERITPARLEKERFEKEQRERRREYERERERDRNRDDRERASRHLRRPEAVRRSSSHAEGERRARERDRDYYDSRYMMPSSGRGGGRGLSPAAASHRRFAVPADGRGYD